MKNRIVTTVLGTLTLASAAQPARADDSRELAAESRFVEGVRLMKSGNCREALPRFRESQELSPASGTLLDIGYCEAALGHSARAWLAYRRALSLAEASGKPKHAEMAKAEAERLQGQLAWVAFRVAGDQRWTLALDTEQLPDPTSFPELPVDPGAHTLVGSVSGEPRLNRTLELNPGQHLTIELTAQAPSPPRTPDTKPRGSTPKQRSTPPVASEHAASSKAPFYALVAGGVLFGSGLAVFAHARYRYDSASCPDNTCDGAPRNQRISAGKEAFVSLALAGAGVATAGVALALHLTGTPRDAAEKQGLSLLVQGGPAQCGLGLRGAF